MHHILTPMCHILRFFPNCCEEGQRHRSALQNNNNQNNNNQNNAHNLTLVVMTVGGASGCFAQYSQRIAALVVSTPLFVVYLLSMICFHGIFFEVFTLLHDFPSHVLGLRL